MKTIQDLRNSIQDNVYKELGHRWYAGGSNSVFHPLFRFLIGVMREDNNNGRN